MLIYFPIASVLSFTNPKLVLKYLICWGRLSFPDGASLKQLFLVKKNRRSRKQTTDFPNIFRCYIFGAPKAGKTTLLKNLAGLPFEEKPYAMTTWQTMAASTIKHENEKYILMVR